jgi:hypothetical protein
MLTRDEQKTWRLNAYNAALTGLLTSKADELDRFLVLTALNPSGQGKAFAEQALDARRPYQTGQTVLLRYDLSSTPLNLVRDCRYVGSV